MISRIGSQGYTQGANRVGNHQVEALESRTRPSSSQESREPAREAAVVRIGVDARARATEAEVAARAPRPDVGAAAEVSAEINIEPVVAQPVPDFNAARSEARAPRSNAAAPTDRNRANEAAINAYQSNRASTSGYDGVA